MDGRPFAGTQCSNAYGMDLHACTVLLQGCNALGEPCIAQCLFIACTEYDHLLFTACSLSADIVAGNPSSGAVLVDPPEDSPSRPTQVSRSVLVAWKQYLAGAVAGLGAPQLNGPLWNDTASEDDQ